MVIHPPVMFSGFASLSVPFAFAIAALWKKRWDGWVARAIPWALFTFVTLGTAILMGGYWAYKTLGWGGYWGWDPVENTSLVPWLCTVALVHGMFLQRARKRHRKVNLILACLAFVDDPLRHVPDPLRDPRGLLRALLHRPRDHGLARRDPARVPRALARRCSRGAGARSPSRQEEEAPLLSRCVLFILGIAVFCALGLRDPARDVGAAPHAAVRQPVAGPDVLLQPNDDARGGAARCSSPALVPFVSWKGETWREPRRERAPVARSSPRRPRSLAFVSRRAGAREPRHPLRRRSSRPT